MELDQELYTKAETARILGVSLYTINKWIDNGILPIIHLLKKDYIKKDDIMQLIKEKEGN